MMNIKGKRKKISNLKRGYKYGSDIVVTMWGKNGRTTWPSNYVCDDFKRPTDDIHISTRSVPRREQLEFPKWLYVGKAGFGRRCRRFYEFRRFHLLRSRAVATSEIRHRSGSGQNNDGVVGHRPSSTPQVSNVRPGRARAMKLTIRDDRPGTASRHGPTYRITRTPVRRSNRKLKTKQNAVLSVLLIKSTGIIRRACACATVRRDDDARKREYYQRSVPADDRRARWERKNSENAMMCSCEFCAHGPVGCCERRQSSPMISNFRFNTAPTTCRCDGERDVLIAISVRR